MNKLERPSGIMFISEEESETLTQTPDGKQQIVVHKRGIPPSIGDSISLSLPDRSPAIGKVIDVKEIQVKGDAPIREVLLEIQPD